jgi:hypothetical protein
MSRAFPASRLALILRRLRGRFGIAAPQVAVRTHLPWHVRALVILGVLALGLVISGWAFDVGRRMAGFDQSESGQLTNSLRDQNASLQEEVARLRSLVLANESSLQIERATGKQLAEKNNLLVADNARLKEDLAVFEHLAKLEGKTGADISLDRLSVNQESPGRYRFGFLIALQNARRGKEAKFDLQLIVVPRAGASDANIKFPGGKERDPSQYEIVVRNFRRIEGKFEVPAAFAVGSVEFRIIEAGLLKTSKSVAL